MHISPISFGKAIKVNASPSVANTIAQAANSMCATTSLEKFSQSIFDDTYFHGGEAKVVAITPDDVYIFSGKDAEEQARLSKETADKNKSELKFVDILPDRITREKRKAQVEMENNRRNHFLGYKIKKMAEDGTNGKPMSYINVVSTRIKSDLYGVYDLIEKISYTSQSPSKTEQKELILQ